MRISKLSAALAAAVTLSFASLAAADAPDPNRVIVKFVPGAASQIEGIVNGARGRVHHRFDELDAMAITLPEQALNGLRNNPNVVYIEQDVARYPMAQSVPYGITMVQAPTLVGTGADGTGIKVCIIDSGIKANHEDFADVALTGQSGQAWNVDGCGHGTHVAGTIAAADNTLGVVGVSPGKTPLHIVKVFGGAADNSSCTWSYSSTLIAAANECASAGAKIISMSLGGSTSSTTENTAFTNLYNNGNGILSIAAAGNAGNTTMSYPASYSSVMSVAAVDSNKALASFSQRNSQVEIAAPGVAVLSTYPIRQGGVDFSNASYAATAMTGSPALARSGAVVDGGLCDSQGAWTGKVVLCQRGVISFADKVLNAQRGGGVAAIVYNNVAGEFGGTLNGTATTIPSVSMSLEDGSEIKAQRLGQTASVSAITQSDANGYASLDGTSMATPHVSGVAAIVWSAKPTATAGQVRSALTSTAEDLGTAGRDNSFGFGLVRAFAAADALVNGGGSNPPPAGAPTSLVGSKSTKGPNTTFSIRWSGGGSTVDIFRGTSKIRSAVSNSGSYSETLKNTTSATYKVCNAGSTTACSNSLTL